MVFARDLEWAEFDSTIQNQLTVEVGEIRLYRPLLGNRQDMQWKPIGYAEEDVSMLEKYATVGIEIVKSKVAK